jgi:hypothetical protein
VINRDGNFVVCTWVQQWPMFQQDLPYHITPFVPPSGAGQLDVKYSYPNQPVANPPPPASIYPADSKFAVPVNYDAKVASPTMVSAVVRCVVEGCHVI